jgi:hypothetical protein
MPAFSTPLVIKRAIRKKFLACQAAGTVTGTLHGKPTALCLQNQAAFFALLAASNASCTRTLSPETSCSCGHPTFVIKIYTVLQIIIATIYSQTCAMCYLHL